MVSSISGNAGTNTLQMMMAAMQKKMQSADTDGKEGLSKEELSSIDAGDDKGGVRFLNELTQNFDKIDGNGDGQLSKDEIKAAAPPKGPMGPPPGMQLDGSSSKSSSSNQTYDALDTNKDGEVSIQERLAGLLKESNSSDSSANSVKNNLSSYVSKLLSSYQNNSSELTSSLNLAV